MIKALVILLLACVSLHAGESLHIRLLASGFRGTNFNLVKGETLVLSSVLATPEDRYPRVQVRYPEMDATFNLSQGQTISGPASVVVMGATQDQAVAVECVWTFNSRIPPLFVPKEIRIERSSDLSLWEPFAIIRDDANPGFWRLTWKE